MHVVLENLLPTCSCQVPTSIFLARCPLRQWGVPISAQKQWKGLVFDQGKKRCELASSTARVPSLSDLMPDDLRWSWCNINKNKVHNKCNALELSPNHLLLPGWGKKSLPQKQSLGLKRLGMDCSCPTHSQQVRGRASVWASLNTENRALWIVAPDFRAGTASQQAVPTILNFSLSRAFLWADAAFHARICGLKLRTNPLYMARYDQVKPD